MWISESKPKRQYAPKGGINCYKICKIKNGNIVPYVYDKENITYSIGKTYKKKFWLNNLIVEKINNIFNFAYNVKEKVNLFGIKTGYHSYSSNLTYVEECQGTLYVYPNGAQKNVKKDGDELIEVTSSSISKRWEQVLSYMKHNAYGVPYHRYNANDVAVVFATIPEGSAYYVNENGVIVSQSISIDSVLTNYEDIIKWVNKTDFEGNSAMIIPLKPEVRYLPRIASI